MGIFGNLGTEGLEKAEDRLGGYAPLPSDAYTGPIKLAYAGKSEGGAMSVTVHVDVGGKEYRETLWVTNKKGENFFLNRNDTSKKVPLPGFTVINDMCIVTTDKPLSEQATEEKVVKLYDYDEGKEVPKSVDVLIDLLEKPVTLGILQNLENKNVKQADGSYAPGPEERTVNVIDKVFHEPTKMTVVEAQGGATEATFFNSWVERNQGTVRDRRTIKDGQGGTSGRPGASGGAPAAGEAPQRKSLFGG